MPHHVADLPGFLVSKNFAVTPGIETDERRDRWALTHIPSGGGLAWAKDGELLIWLALRLEAVDPGNCMASPQPWIDHPREFAAVNAERMRLFGCNLLLDPEP